MKLHRTKEYHFGWMMIVPAVDILFLLIFFVLLSSNFVLHPGIAVALPTSRFTLPPQPNQQILSIIGGATPAIYFREQKISLEQLGPLLDNAKHEGASIVIKADRSTSYDTVVQVTNLALERGVSSVSLATTAPR